MFPRPHFFDWTDNNVTVEPSFPSLNVLLILPSHPPLDRYPRSPQRTLGRECPLPRLRGDFCRVKHGHAGRFAGKQARLSSRQQTLCRAIAIALGIMPIRPDGFGAELP
jgi:hypothetical protein